jgi:hypothetical protein
LWSTAESKYSPNLLDDYKKEIARLTDQLPLMETITRREFIKQRIREFSRSAKDPARTYQDPGRLIREEKQRQELERELKRLNETLLSELPAYEKKYNAPLNYRGQQYLEQMNNEGQE